MQDACMHCWDYNVQHLQAPFLTSLVLSMGLKLTFSSSFSSSSYQKKKKPNQQQHSKKDHLFSVISYETEK